MTDDCSSMQGSLTSGSSDAAVTLTTTLPTSWCAIPASARMRVLRLVRPHIRRVLVAPADLAPSYGFSVRGGREFGTGFFVSNVTRASEAEQKGLRVGDQILRINGYRVDDAVHKEVTQFVNSQDRITLKVRGVGMLPVKDKAADRLSWHVVRPATCSSSGTPSESSYASTTIERRDRPAPRRRSREVSVVLHVAPRSKLGLGICKGPDWKPGIYVQFTKDKSVAREAGLRQGDQILSVNSIDFADVLFSEAVAVMKSANRLEMLVLTAAGCDLFLGESSGYNSSASSLTGDQSPCWADAKSKRLTAVREEASASWQEPATLQRDVRRPLRSRDDVPPRSTAKQLNKTIIKLSESGTSINNTYIANGSSRLQDAASGATYRRLDPIASASVPPPPPPQLAITEVSGEQNRIVVDLHGADQQTQQTNSTVSNVRNSSNPPGGEDSLCSAITLELRKRKEKQRLGAAAATEGPHNSSDNKGRSQQEQPRQCSAPASSGAADRAQRSGGGASGGGDQHNALMHEFMSFHQRMFRNGFHESEQERQEALKRTTMMANEADHRGSPPIGGADRATKLPSATDKVCAPDATMPPPPAQFANATLRASPPGAREKVSKGAPPSTLSDASSGAVRQSTRPPQSPAPDYDNLQLRRSSGARVSSSVTIAEYAQQQRQHSGKADGSASIKHQSELQSTLARSQMKQPQHDLRRLQHKQDCPLLRKGNADTQGAARRAGSGNGILKNANSHHSVNGLQSSGTYAAKSGEKSITFGN